MTSKTRKGRRTFGSVRQLDSRRWQIRYRDNDGVEHKGVETYPTETAADAALAAIRTDLGRGSWSEVRPGRPGSRPTPSSGSRSAG